MALPAAAARIVLAALTNERARKTAGWIAAAILAPIILIAALLLSLLSGTTQHNNAAVDLVFNGGSIPSTMSAEYAAQVHVIITHFARAGTLYEDAEYHNAVFVGTDEHGVPRHAQKRSTNSQGRSFKLNVEGSEARYSFHHLGDDGELYVFEAPIDLLSYLALYPEDWQHHSYVACCGTSYEPVRWMLTQMETPQMVSLCLDHDRAGERGSERMAEQIASEFGIPTRRLISEQKDWNEDLCAMLEHPKQGMEMKMR